MSAVLVDALEGRWGPSDQDEEAWLAFRRTGLTATEVRDLYLGVITMEQLAAQKLGRRKVTFGGNRYTAWGKQRGPIIAAEAARRFAVAPESRVLRDPVDARRLASPDGIGWYGLTGDLCVGEYKTTGAPLPYGSPAFEAKGYLAQIVWTMLRVRAVACLYGWEMREDDGFGGFTPGALTFEWILLADHLDLAAELEQIGTNFLAVLDRVAAEPWEAADLDEDLDTLAVNVLAFRVAEAEAKAAKEAAWAELLDRLAKLGRDFQQESMLARITYTAAREEPVDVTDEEAAIAANPELWESLELLRAEWAEHAAGFTKPSTRKKPAGLTVTAVKQKGPKA